MGVVAARWTPQDDLLLKNAVEVGASLQSLARGAVQFSRRFTFAEIQNRWHSLLYDPVISWEASACMADFMLSASPLPSKFTSFEHSRPTNFASLKRKSQSISNSYYAMRKRIFDDTISSLVSNFLAQPENSNYLETAQHCMPQVAASHHFVFQDSNFDSIQSDFSQDMMDRSVSINGLAGTAIHTGVKNTVEATSPIHHKNIPKQETQILRDISSNGGVGELGDSRELAVDTQLGLGDNSLKGMLLSTFDHINNEPANLCSELEGNHVLDSSDSECGMSFNTWQFSPYTEIPSWRIDNCIQETCNNFIDSIASRDAYTAQLSNSPLNFTDEEEIYLMDVDIGDEFEKPDYEAISSFLLDSPNEVSSDQIPKLPKAQPSMASNASLKNLSVSFDAEVDNNLGSGSSQRGLVNKSEVQMPSSILADDPRFPELVNGVICCTLNTEDPEIPSNDDVVQPFDVPLSTLTSSFRWSIQVVNKPISSSVEDLGHGHRAIEGCTKLIQLEEKNLGESHLSNKIGPAPNLDNMSTNCVVHGNPKEEATNIGLAKHSGNEKRSHESNGFRNDADTNASGREMEKDAAMPIQDHQMLHAEEGSSPTLDQEEQLLESDDDVPYYSDVEAMILDMDLDHDDRRWYYGEEVLRYGHEDTKRAIMRLEQVARSSMERDISLHGAFAVLCGRYSRHYIKKTEVLLGRATEDIVVDIDLSKERGATKISRRQAIIKMDKVGSFYLKNLGRDRILVNDKEVHPGLSQILHSSCLIEIRGMPYIFETNRTGVKKYLHDITQNIQI